MISYNQPSKSLSSTSTFHSSSRYKRFGCFCINANICALGVMEVARQKGVRIPVELSIVGFDNLNICNYTSPKLTTVSQNVPQKAMSAVKLLLEKIETGKVQSNSVIIDVEIVERQSVIPLI